MSDGHAKINRDEVLSRRIDCLDKGFIRMVDYMGSDAAIVQAARVSYGEGTKTVRQDRELIRYLLRHRHTSPFEMVEFKFHVKLPIFVARQWIRHRTANVNEYSGRYSEMKDEFYLPEPEQVRPQNKHNRQGRAEETIDQTMVQDIIKQLAGTQQQLFGEYQGFLDHDLARELARINLPLSTYTEWYWKIDLHNLLHFLGLRMDSHAQYEIQVYANAIVELIKPVVPIVLEAFQDYRSGSCCFSRNELKIIRDMIRGRELNTELMEEYGIEGLEGREFREKNR